MYNKTNNLKLQDKLQEGQPLNLLNNEELKYAMKPIGKAVYNNAINNSDNDFKNNVKHHTDKIKCPICNVVFSRSGLTNHRKTRYHIRVQSINYKLRDVLLN